MNAKKARLKRQIDRSSQFVRYEAWKSIEPPRYRFIQRRKWKKLGVRLGFVL